MEIRNIDLNEDQHGISALSQALNELRSRLNSAREIMAATALRVFEPNELILVSHELLNASNRIYYAELCCFQRGKKSLVIATVAVNRKGLTLEIVSTYYCPVCGNKHHDASALICSADCASRFRKERTLRE